VRDLLGMLLDALRLVAAMALEGTPAGDPAPSAGPTAPSGALRTPRTALPFVPPRLGSVGDVTPGIDLSLWNRGVPYRALRDAGVRFALIKASQGTTIADPADRDHVRAARRAGLLVGPYHFYDYRLDGRAQADHFIDTLVAAGTLGRSLPLVVDVECFGPFGAADRAYVRSELRAFTGRVYERTGRLPMVYTSWYMWREVTGSDPSLGRLPLWVACWRCGRPLLPVGWDDWDFWQIGSIVTGDDGRRVGSDVYGGTPGDLRRLVRDRGPR
jgi:GH25 family lysozyme M1 (1,4-beta-N-acetylmuramidase)